MRGFLKFLALFDWITAAEIGARRLVSGPAETFALPEGYEWSGGDVCRVLERAGIPTYAHMVRGDAYVFRVPLAYAEAADALIRENFPLEV